MVEDHRHVDKGALGDPHSTDQMSELASAAAVDQPGAPQPQYHRQTMTTTIATENHILTDGKRTLSSALRSYQYVTSGFYKFLARFSGECFPLIYCHV